MNDRNELAKELASKPYTLMVIRDSITTDEDDYVYIAMNPELEHCIAQGITMEEAKENLEDVRVSLIEHLLEHGLDIPVPSWEAAFVGSGRLEIGKVEGELGEKWDFERSIPLGSSEESFRVQLMDFV